MINITNVSILACTSACSPFALSLFSEKLKKPVEFL